MALHLNFNSNLFMCGDIMRVEHEDINKAREIGVLTPRSTCADDLVPAPKIDPCIEEKCEISWADKVRGTEDSTCTSGNPCSGVSATAQLVDDLDFLLMQEVQESELDEISRWIDEETTNEITLTSCPHEFGLCPTKRQQPVRVTAVDRDCYFGTTDGNTTVYIPMDVVCTSLECTDLHCTRFNRNALSLHAIYMMDLEFHPVGKNAWRAVEIHPKVLIADLLISQCSGEYWDEDPDPVATTCKAGPVTYNTWTYQVPCPTSMIGKIVGREGKNITALLENKCDPQGWGWSGVLPEITITPVSDDMIQVSVYVSNKMNSYIHQSQIDEIVSYFQL